LSVNIKITATELIFSGLTLHIMLNFLASPLPDRLSDIQRVTLADFGRDHLFVSIRASVQFLSLGSEIELWFRD
jgi:hypothetical protein